MNTRGIHKDIFATPPPMWQKGMGRFERPAKDLMICKSSVWQPSHPHSHKKRKKEL